MRLEDMQENWRSSEIPQGAHAGRGNHGFCAETTQSMQLADAKVAVSMQQDWRSYGTPRQSGDGGRGNHGLSFGAAERYSQSGTAERYSAEISRHIRNGTQQQQQQQQQQQALPDARGQCFASSAATPAAAASLPNCNNGGAAQSGQDKDEWLREVLYYAVYLLYWHKVQILAPEEQDKEEWLREVLSLLALLVYKSTNTNAEGAALITGACIHRAASAAECCGPAGFVVL